MSLYAKAFSSFLAQTFCPVKISFVSKPLIYSNPLFSVTHRTLGKYNDNNCEAGYIKFYYALNKNLCSQYNFNNKINTPESFIKFILDKPNNNTIFELTKNNDMVEFNTNGTIPLRYIDMINDFSLNKLYYNKPTRHEIKNYEDKLLEKISKISDNILIDIFNYAKYLSIHDKYIKMVVNKAPSYPLDDDFIQKYYTPQWRSTFSHEDIYRSIKQCIWHSGDGDMSSPSTKIFFNRSKSVSSLNNIGYKVLFSASGGINMSYVENLPWFQLQYMFGNKQIYFDLSGQDKYYSTSFDLTEFIIFSEVLAKENADYKLEVD